MIMVVMKIFHFWPQYYPCYMLPCLLEIILAIQSRKIVSLQTRCRVLIVSENLPGMDDTKVIFQIHLLYTIPNIKKIKGIYTDDYIFIIGETTNGWNNCLASLSTLWNMEKVSKIRLTIFSNFCYTKKLQRLSIRYVGYWCHGETMKAFPQEALIKFVQNTLPKNVQWLWSDLSKEILQVFT